MAAGLAGACGLAGSAMFAAPAMAHDSVVSSNPEKGSSISSLPAEITLEFSGEPKEGFNTVALSHDGEVLLSEEPTVNGRTLTVDVPEDVKAEPGEYLIGFQITSSDGHATRGSLDFTLNGDGAASNDSDDNSTQAAGDDNSQGEQGDTQDSVPTWLLPLGGIVVVAGALVVAIARYRDLKK